MIVKDLIKELHTWDGQAEVLLHTSQDIFRDYRLHHLEVKPHESWNNREEKFMEGVAVVLFGGRLV